MRGQVQELQRREGFAQQTFGVEIFDLFRAAGAVLELIGVVALQQQDAAGLEGAIEAGKDARTLGRCHELKEDRCHHIVLTLVPVPGIDVALAVVDIHLALGRQFFCLVHGQRREVEGGDIQSLLGQPDAVASFAIGDT